MLVTCSPQMPHTAAPTSFSLTIVRVKNKIKNITFRGPLNSCNTLFPVVKDRPCPRINGKVQTVFDSKYNTIIKILGFLHHAL
jgi:hypothetical protein